jgi:hypothetical protein
MTSSINNLVSVLTGANYLSWAPVMKGFLMAQGVSHVLTETCPSPTTYDDNSNNANDIYSWKQDDTKALGYLILRVQESICVKHDALTSCKSLLGCALHRVWHPRCLRHLWRIQSDVGHPHPFQPTPRFSVQQNQRPLHSPQEG